MSKHGEFLIWWTSEHDVRAIGDDVYSLPPYLKNELLGRLGRPGRGRLWLGPGFPLDLKVEPWPDSALARYCEAHCGGIVLHAMDFVHLATMPGVVTTFKLERA